MSKVKLIKKMFSCVLAFVFLFGLLPFGDVSASAGNPPVLSTVPANGRDTVLTFNGWSVDTVFADIDTEDFLHRSSDDLNITVDADAPTFSVSVRLKNNGQVRYVGIEKPVDAGTYDGKTWKIPVSTAASMELTGWKTADVFTDAEEGVIDWKLNGNKIGVSATTSPLDAIVKLSSNGRVKYIGINNGLSYSPGSACDVLSVTSPSGAVISGTDITASVAHSVSSQLITVTVSAKASWKLYSNAGCTTENTNKTMPLAEGDNTAYIKVTAEDGTAKVYTVVITREPPAVDPEYTGIQAGIPELNSNTASRVVLKTMLIDGETVEYAYSTTNTAPTADVWQISTTFNSLSENTQYYFFARVRAMSGTHLAGAASEGLGVKTDAAVGGTKTEVIYDNPSGFAVSGWNFMINKIGHSDSKGNTRANFDFDIIGPGTIMTVEYTGLGIGLALQDAAYKDRYPATATDTGSVATFDLGTEVPRLAGSSGNVYSFIITGSITIKKVSITYPVETGFMTWEEAGKAAQANIGDITRVADVMKRADDGEDVNIVYFGGSITLGSGYEGTKWAQVVHKWFNDTYGDKVNYINSSIGGVGSAIDSSGNTKENEWGVNRLKTAVLDKNPDLVFVEFSVNDGGYGNFGDRVPNAYEKIIRTLLEKDIAVIILNTMDFSSGDNTQAMHNAIGAHYSVPIVSAKDGLWTNLKLSIAGNSVEGSQLPTREQFGSASDSLHPNATGHNAYAQMVLYTLKEINAQKTDVTGAPVPIPELFYPDNMYYGNVDAALITLNKGATTLPAGGMEKLFAKVDYSVDNPAVVWSSSDPAVATVDKTGIVLPQKAGTTTITATTGDGEYEADCVVTVVNYDATLGGQYEYVTTITLYNADMNWAKPTDDNSSIASPYDPGGKISNTTAKYYPFLLTTLQEENNPYGIDRNLHDKAYYAAGGEEKLRYLTYVLSVDDDTVAFGGALAGSPFGGAGRWYQGPDISDFRTLTYKNPSQATDDWFHPTVEKVGYDYVVTFDTHTDLRLKGAPSSPENGFAWSNHGGMGFQSWFGFKDAGVTIKSVTATYADLPEPSRYQDMSATSRVGLTRIPFFNKEAGVAKPDADNTVVNLTGVTEPEYTFDLSHAKFGAKTPYMHSFYFEVTLQSGTNVNDVKFEVDLPDGVKRALAPIRTIKVANNVYAVAVELYENSTGYMGLTANDSITLRAVRNADKLVSINSVTGSFLNLEAGLKPLPPQPEGVTVAPKEIQIVQGRTKTVTATVTPSNAVDKSVTWSSTDEAVATVTQSGVVKAEGVGSCDIIATTSVGGFTDTCAVTVTEDPNANRPKLDPNPKEDGGGPVVSETIIINKTLDGVAPNKTVSFSMNKYIYKLSALTSVTVKLASGSGNGGGVFFSGTDMSDDTLLIGDTYTDPYPADGWFGKTFTDGTTMIIPQDAFLYSDNDKIYMGVEYWWNSGGPIIVESVTLNFTPPPTIDPDYSGIQAGEPTLASKTSTRVVLNAVTVDGEVVEYAKNTTNTAPASDWQESTTFSGLSASTQYYFFARVRASIGTHKAGKASTGLSVMTDDPEPGTERTYLPTADRVKFLGRSYFNDSTTNKGLWGVQSGTGCEFNVTGTYAKVTVMGRKARIVITLDGERVVDKKIGDNVTETITVFEGSTQRTATIAVIKVLEAAESISGIKEIITDGMVTPADEMPFLIEFIGDSITCGYGIDPPNHNPINDQDFTKAFAYKTAQLLAADYSVVARSGSGAVGHYTGTGVDKDGKISPSNIWSTPAQYGNYGFTWYPVSGLNLYNIPWNFQANREPDVVVVGLGTNDAGYANNDTKRAEFEQDAIAFITEIRSKNPDALIVWAYGVMGAGLYPNIVNAITTYSASTSDNKVTSMQFDGHVDASVAGGHPSAVTNTAMANKLAAFLSPYLPSEPVEGVTVTPESLSIRPGQVRTLRAKVTPANAVDKTVTWHSDNDAVATVTQQGDVMAHAVGQATITVTTNTGGFTADCVVDVTSAEVAIWEGSKAVTSNLDYNSGNALTIEIGSQFVVSDLEPGLALMVEFIGTDAPNLMLRRDVGKVADVAYIAPDTVVNGNKAVFTHSTIDSILKAKNNALPFASISQMYVLGRSQSAVPTTVTKVYIGDMQGITVTGSEVRDALDINWGYNVWSPAPVYTTTVDMALDHDNNRIKKPVYTIEGYNANNLTIEWTSNNKSVAKVAADGTITATDVGSAVIMGVLSTSAGTEMVVTANVNVKAQGTPVYGKVLFEGSESVGGQDHFILATPGMAAGHTTPRVECPSADWSRTNAFFVTCDSAATAASLSLNYSVYSGPAVLSRKTVENDDKVAVFFLGDVPSGNTMPPGSYSGLMGSGKVLKIEVGKWPYVAPKPELFGKVEITGTNKIGQTLTADTSKIVGGKGAFSYQWKADGEDIAGKESSTYVIHGDYVGQIISCEVTRADANGSITGTMTGVVPYTIQLFIVDYEGDDSVTATPDTGLEGDEITLDYNVAESKLYNRLYFDGATAPLATVEEAGSGTQSYFIAAEDAFEGIIEIEATFAHSDLTLEEIAFTNTAEHINVIYGGTLTNAIDPGKHEGTGEITYHSSNQAIADVDNAGVVSILKAGSVVITAEKAEDDFYAHASKSYTLNIAPKPVTITGITAQDKVYDGNATAAASGTAVIDGLINSDVVAVGEGDAKFNNKNAGAGKTVTFSDYYLTGTHASNYTLSEQPDDVTAEIIELQLTIGDPSGAPTRKYDGTTVYTGGGVTIGNLTNVIDGDTVNVSIDSMTFNDADVDDATDITIVYKISGADAGNYSIPADGTLAATITKADGAAIGVPPTVSGEPGKDTIVVNAATLPSNPGSQEIEYAISRVNNSVPEDGWQSSTTFSGLLEDTKYYIYARTVENNNFNTGTAKVSAEIATDTDKPKLDVVIGNLQYVNSSASDAVRIGQNLSPMTATGYSERRAKFTVTVSGFESDSEANNVMLDIDKSGLPATMTVTGDNKTGNATGGTKAFNVIIDYNGTVTAGTLYTLIVNGLTDGGGGILDAYSIRGETGEINISIFDGDVAAANYTFTPTRPIPVTQENIMAFNSYFTSNASKHYRQVEDIDLTGKTWSPPNATLYQGTYNGGGFTISNLTISVPTANYPAGFFRTIGSYGVVSNLGLIDVSIVGGQTDAAASTGAIAGYVTGGQGGAVRNCYVTGNVSGGQNTGGIAGKIDTGANSKIENCYFSGTVTGSATGTNIGGIVGLYTANATVRNNVALNTTVTSNNESNTAIGRVTGSATTSNFTNNYALDTMTVTVTGGTWTPDKGANKKDGDDVTDAEALTAAWWTDNRWYTTSPSTVWLETIWKIIDGAYPTLIKK